MKPRTVVTYKLLSIAVTACTTPAPPADKDARPDLVALRDELDRSGRASALARQDHFRPLCDADGYPLVGNLQRKFPNPEAAREAFGPVAFCAAVREKKATRS